jgi:multidrug efflux pump subunit AcrA (membrane-fusion protein)
LAFCLLLLGIGCGGTDPSGLSVSESTPGERLPAGVPAAQPVRGEYEEEILLTGELRAVRATTIVAPETSIFQMRIQFLPEEGTEVREGDPLLDFDNSALSDRVLDLETRILNAETQIAAKRSELATNRMDLEIERTERLYERDRARVRAQVDPSLLSRKEYAERQYEYDKAQMELEEVEKRLAKNIDRGRTELDVLIIEKEKLQRDLLSTQKDLEVLSIKAPIDGLVVYEYRRGQQIKWKEGDNVWPGQPIISLPDLSEMEVQFQVSEVDVPRLHVGLPVRVTVDSFPERELSGEILEIPSMAVTRDEDSEVRIFRVRSSLSETLRDKMKPGMSVLGRVTADRRAEALLVPRESVVQDGSGYRLRVEGRGESGWKEIRPIARNARYYVLEEQGEPALAGSDMQGSMAGEDREASERARSAPSTPSETGL